MAFGSVCSGIIFAYFTYYAGNVIYDINKKSKEDGIKADEEEIDIEEIAGQVIQTRQVDKNSLGDYLPSINGDEVEGHIMSDAICKIDELLKMFKENPDHPDNPLRRSNIAYWVTE